MYVWPFLSYLKVLYAADATEAVKPISLHVEQVMANIWDIRTVGKKKLGIDDTFNSEAHRLKIECISLSGSIFISCKIELIFGRLTVIVVYLHFILEKFDFKQKTQFSKQSEFYKSGCWCNAKVDS